MQAADRWQIAAPKLITWREWGDEWIVHVDTHAETHLLSPVAGHVLRILLEEGRPLCPKALFERAFGNLQAAGLAMTFSEHVAMQSILSDLERKGVVTRLGL